MAELLNTAKDSIGFLAVCALICAALLLLAKLAEHFLMPGGRRAKGAAYLAYVAAFGAIGGILMLIEIPLFFAPGFYKIDLSELPTLLCGFYLGPVGGVLAELLKILLKLLIKGTSTMFVGEFANFVVGCFFVLPAAILYHAKKTKKMSVVAMTVGTLCMTVFGSVFNALYLVPKFAELFHMPLETIIGMGTAVNSMVVSLPTLILFAVVPFNLIKGIVVSLLSFFLYKRLERVLFRKR